MFVQCFEPRGVGVLQISIIIICWSLYHHTFGSRALAVDFSRTLRQGGHFSLCIIVISISRVLSGDFDFLGYRVI